MPDESVPQKKKPVWPWVLGGCGCLAALGFAALIVAAIALPMIAPRRYVTFETNGAADLRAYCGAQVMYHRNDWDGNRIMEYATPYTKLCDTKDVSGNELTYIDAAFAAAQGPTGAPKHGYIFQDMQTLFGEKIDWENDYALCATPAVYGKTGYRTFIICTNGTVYGKDLGGSQFVTDYPADPSAEGWVIAE